MEKVIAIEGPFSCGDVTLVAVVVSSLTYKGSHKGIWLSGYKFPIALILTAGSVKRAFRTTGEEVPVEQLIAEFPDIGINL